MSTEIKITQTCYLEEVRRQETVFGPLADIRSEDIPVDQNIYLA